MFDREYDISRIIVKHFREELDAVEKAVLNSWLEASPINRDLFKELSNDRQLLKNINQFRLADRDSLWSKTMSKINGEDISQQTLTPKISPNRKYQYLVIAASLILVVGLVFYFKPGYISKNAQVQVASQITPGRNSATLTLSNGRKILLSETLDGEIAKQKGVSIRKMADGQLVYTLTDVKTSGKISYNTLSTARGEQYQIILPDGTKIWLNAASSIVYAESFGLANERKIQLVGEAYFEVAKDRHKPFYVESKGQKVEVLGTHFNINCYEDEAAVKTTLLEGSIRINGTSLIKPNEQAVVTENGIKIFPVIADAFIDWKEGTFAFKSEDLPSVMRKISRWYDVEIVYQLSVNHSQTYTGTISKYDHIHKVLHVLEEIGGLKFKIEGKRIVVSN